jgi:hypothetical protein
MLGTMPVFRYTMGCRFGVFGLYQRVEVCSAFDVETKIGRGTI